MSVHYKFKSALKYDTITFDGLHISVKDLKRDILQQKQIGKTGDFDLQITNAQTNEVYQDENTLIPKNSALIVVRIPLTAQQKRAWDRQEANQQLAGLKHVNPNLPLTYQEGQDPLVQKLAKAVDLSSLDASEDDKIAAMMTQSTLDYDPVNYARIRGTSQVGEVPANYRCFKCHQAGHWIKDCRLAQNQENQPEIRKSTGIPRSFMVPVEGPQVPGAMITPSGEFAVPSIDRQAYMEGKKPSAPPEEQEAKPAIPEELVCSICHDLLTDTVMIPCCGSSFCDECIRNVLLNSENHQCPDCREIGVSPDTMIPNRYLRKCVDNFRNTTGYQRTIPSRSHSQGNPNPNPPPPLQTLQQPPPAVQNIPALGNRAPEVINLVEAENSPVRLRQLPQSRRTNNVVPKGADHRGDRMQSQYAQPDRSATPTVDERTTLPDTSIPPPVNTYPITSTAYPPANYGGPPPPGYVGPPPNYPRVPLPYPNLGPGPAPNYPPVEPRGSMRGGYGRPYVRRGGNNRLHGYHDRTDRNNLPPGAIDDPLSAFEKILREKDKARERHRRRKRSFSRSLSPRPRSRGSRSRTRSPPGHVHRKRGSVSPSPPPVRPRSRSRSRSPSPPPRRHSPPSPAPRQGQGRAARSRSLQSRTPPPPRRSRTPPRKERRSPSFTISKSRSRSFSRTPSPRDRHFSPRRRDERFRSPLQGRNSPQRFHNRRRPPPEDYDAGQYYEGPRRGARARGYQGPRQEFYTSPVRYDNRYEDRGRGYQGGRGEPAQPGRYNRSNRYDYGDTVPPGTEAGNFDQYAGDFTERRVVVVSDKRDREREREREREAAARDWERTRDRELETREKERLREYEEYHRGYRKSSSPRKARSHERGKENKRGEGEAIEAISLRDQNLDQYKNAEPPVAAPVSTRGRVPVLVDLKKEPSAEREKKKEKEESTTPTKEKEKKKEKDKKKKRKEEGDKKEKKKKRKEKKEGEKIKDEKMVPVKTVEGKPIVVVLKGDVNTVDPLYGDIEGTSVDKEVVQNYGKVESKVGEGENAEGTNEPNGEVKENVMLAPVPELSKWELEEDLPSQDDKIGGDDGSNSAEKKVVTSEVLKRAENAIFQKAINAIRPMDAKKGAVVEKVPEKIKERKESKDAPPKLEAPQETINISPETTAPESREARKVANSIQITIPSHQSKAPERSVEIASTTISIDSSDPLKSRSHTEKSKVASVPVIPTSPVRKSAKERLGAKIETDREEVRRVRSAVERKSRSKTPKRYLDRKYGEREKPREISPGGRRVVVSSTWTRERDREEGRRRVVESSKSMERKVEKLEKTHEKEKDRRRDKKSRSSSRERKHRKELKAEKIIIRKQEEKPEERRVTVKVDHKKEVPEKKARKNPRLSSDRRKSALDEANFEPDYDESEPESEPEVPGEEKNLLVTLAHSPPSKKRSRSPSNEKEKKRLKSECELELVNKPAKEKEAEKVTKKAEPESDESSDSESSSDSSSDSSVERKKKKKKKSKKRKKKKSRKRKDSSSESESSDSSSSDSDVGKKKKKHKHKKKSSKSKKRKKSKHK